MTPKRIDEWEAEETGQWRKRTSDRVRAVENVLQWQRGAWYVMTGLVGILVAVGSWMILGQQAAATHDAQLDAQLEAIVQRLERIERKMDNE